MHSLSSVSAIPLPCEVGDIHDAYTVTFTGSAVMENNTLQQVFSIIDCKCLALVQHRIGALKIHDYYTCHDKGAPVFNAFYEMSRKKHIENGSIVHTQLSSAK